MRRCQPIGLFDSGVGGFTVAQEIFRQLPHEEILYYADTAHVPYGPRSVEELIRFATEITTFLVSQGAKMILVACNTSSSLALQILQERFHVPIVGVVDPGAQEAVKTTRNGRVGVLATEATIRKGAHGMRIQELDSSIQVYGQACPLYVPLVESGKYLSKEAEEASRLYLEPLMKASVDTIILGCTHYPYLEPSIRKIIGDAVHLIDPARQTVAQGKYLIENGIVPARDSRYGKPHHHFYVSGDLQSFRQVGGPLIGAPILQDLRQVSLDGILDGVAPQLISATA
ncbi:glutamate racemase [Heliorestis acidaminivorans]|uniref:Glutamate racemase n=1 Tax=Heliorestis acidaminivorans TaxID=553427 RepID=A0A6I0F5J9_9FIRM|nr:glutamate racemase [Heliorestis acidaminivorans]KAB2952579.1 glutamate racemase [Heliorestis acidaminivorans]